MRTTKIATSHALDLEVKCVRHFGGRITTPGVAYRFLIWQKHLYNAKSNHRTTVIICNLQLHLFIVATLIDTVRRAAASIFSSISMISAGVKDETVSTSLSGSMRQLFSSSPFQFFDVLKGVKSCFSCGLIDGYIQLFPGTKSAFSIV